MQLEIELTDAEHTAIIPGMAYLFKSRTINKRTGKSYRSRKWYGKWKSQSGHWLSKALSEDKKTARKMLMKLCVEDEEQSIRPKKTTLTHLLEEFKKVIESSSTPDYARLLHHRVSSIIKEMGITYPDQIEPGKAKLAAANLTESLRTRNHYEASIKQFCRWLVDNGHAKRNPVAGLKPAKHDADKRYVRRALTQDEWGRLVKATTNSPHSFRGLNGTDRLALYMVVLSTGWRAGGLAQLRTRDFQNDGLVVMEAKYSKNRREQRKFLPPPVHSMMAAYLARKEGNDLAWPGTWAQDAAEMLRIDLEAAKIKHKTEEGVMDFHSFRNTSITWLLEAGTPIYLVQKHADHASPAQTMRYARPKRDNVDDAIEKTFSHIISYKSTPEIQTPAEVVPAKTAIKPTKTKKAHGRTPVGG